MFFSDAVSVGHIYFLGQLICARRLRQSVEVKTGETAVKVLKLNILSPWVPTHTQTRRCVSAKKTKQEMNKYKIKTLELLRRQRIRQAALLTCLQRPSPTPRSFSAAMRTIRHSEAI